MSSLTRREFIKGSLAAGLGVGASTGLVGTVCGQVLGANDNIRVAIVGLRSQGTYHIDTFRKIDGVRVAALCDADRNILEREANRFSERGERVDCYADVRKLLEDKNIDAIATATPNHWHSLLTVWACQAGKDVYVEKPVSHNIWEGRKMVEAARKYKRIVQAGTQRRSDTGVLEAFKYIQQGNLGKIKLARGFCYKRRESIGKVSGPQAIPEGVDYDLWTGPAPLVPLRRKNLHYDWHWVWATGNGDIGNQGVHEMDMCRWILGEKGLARRVMSIGGRFGYEDDGETANTQIAILDYEPVPIIFEVRGLPRGKDNPAMDSYRGIRIGVVIECEGGYFAGGGGGGWVYDNEHRKVKQFSGDGGGGHQGNFIKAVRSRKVSDLNADIEEGHLSSALCHMANISHRLGQMSCPEEVHERIQGNKEAEETFARFSEHLTANEVDLSKEQVVLGPWLAIDPEKERFVSDGEYDMGRWANGLLSREYRKGFTVPAQV